MIWFDKQSSEDLGVYVESYPKRSIPKRKYETVSVPGRNGDILFSQDAFENETREYDIYISAKDVKLHNVAHRVAQWLNRPGYLRLEDTYEPDYYRMAYYTGGADIENYLDEFGRATISFSCLPQRFLKSGEYVMNITKNQYLINPSPYPAKPLIKVTGSGSGTLTIGEKTVNFVGLDSFLFVDSDLQDVYKNAVNQNSKMTGDFPVLEGKSQITWTGGITAVQITPRWYEI